MGIATPAEAGPLARRESTDPELFDRVHQDVRSKGFFVTRLESLVNWARAGSMWRDLLSSQSAHPPDRSGFGGSSTTCSHGVGTYPS